MDDASFSKTVRIIVDYQQRSDTTTDITVNVVNGASLPDLEFVRPASTQITTSDTEHLVNTATAPDNAPSTIAKTDSGFVVVWHQSDPSTGFYDIVAQRYDASSAPIGTAFQVNTTTNDYQFSPSVAAVPGGFVVVWQSFNQDGSGYGVYGQRFDA